MCIDVFLIYLNDLENIHEMNEASSKDKMVGFCLDGSTLSSFDTSPH